jgi:peptide chain release factor 1
MDLRAPLERLKQRFDRVIEELNDPQAMSAPARLTELHREHSRLSPVIQQYQQYLKALTERDELKAWMNGHDPELKKMAQEEIGPLDARIQTHESQLRLALLPRDPNEDRNIILEIRAGAGGDEAGLFGADLLRMYTRYAETRHWKVEPLSLSASERGGIKEAIIQISGEAVWKHLKFERGVHRVQRVPVTEASGRIHTSTATVAVLPEAEEVDLHIDPADLRIDTYRASGAGGQHVNKTESAVRITHNPTGFVVACQDERSQMKNRDKAMKLLRSRLLEQMQEKQAREQSQNRKSQVGTGDRSEKIRTYNFPQDRITDHRINANIHNLPAVMEGDIGSLIDMLIQDEQSRQLADLSQPGGISA